MEVDCDAFDFRSSEGVGRFYYCHIKEQVGELRTYLDIMNDFISKSKREELSKLAQRFESLPPGEYKDSFWPENYPVHWDELIALNLRASFLMLLNSVLESYIKGLCKHIESVTGKEFNCQADRILERAKDYLGNLRGFVMPQQAEWEFICDLKCLRNALVHNGGIIEGCQNEHRIIAFMRKAPGLSIPSYGMLNIENSFCTHALTKAGKLVDSLYESARIIYAGSEP